jgi:hypothetical protein
MKRILVVLALLVVAASAFAVSGKIYMRYGTSGPMWSYWGVQNNVDLWQGKDGTGFDVNTESVGITYRTREQITLPYGLTTDPSYDELGWGVNPTMATSPGYLQIRDIKIGNFSMSIGLAWWQMFGSASSFSTNTNVGGATNANSGSSVTYNKVYLDYKFVLGLGDSVVIKQVDWELMHFEYDYGNQGQGKAGQVTNFFRGGSTLLAHIPLRVFVTLDRLNLDISPKFTYQSVSSGNNPLGNFNYLSDVTRMRFGGTVAISYGLSDSLSIYLEPGYFVETGTTFQRTLQWQFFNGLVTNESTSYSTYTFPIFLGLNYKVGPGIKLTLGYGFNFVTRIDITTVHSSVVVNTTNRVDTVHPRYAGFYNFDYGDQAEFDYYGDSFMDMGFLKFGGDIAFAQAWTLGIQAGVGLNDKWSTWWAHLGTKGSTTTYGTAVAYTYGAQLLSFMNLMDYDNNMYIKYEDDKVAIKGTFFGTQGSTTATTFAGTLSTNVANSANTPINGTITGALMFGFFAW